ncbi:MAG: molybdopterin-guanine dinucleotide biosynthesis protein B [Anaerolineales bacterium]|jgi:molybdopterin-guanine dinucleotide biosynthesis protein MobB
MRADSIGSHARPRLICIVGRSRSGKTTLIEEMIPRLRARGYHVGTIKHHAHSDFDFDVPGKDSWRHARAGSEHVIIASPGKIGSVQLAKRDPPLIELARRMDEVDLILAEGYHWETWPKVEVLRSTTSRDLRCDPDELAAVVSDMALDISIPVFGLEQMDEFVDWVERTFLLGGDRAAKDPV